MSSRRSTRYRKPPQVVSLASVFSERLQKQRGKSSSSTPLLSRRQSGRGEHLQTRSFMSTCASQVIKALKNHGNGLRKNKHTIMSGMASSTVPEKLRVSSKCSTTIDCTSNRSTTPSPPPPPPRLFDFEDSTNQFKSLDDGAGGFSDGSVDMLELPNVIDFSLTQTLNNSSDVRPAEEPKQLCRPQSLNSIPSIDSDYDAEMYKSSYLALLDDRADTSAFSSFERLDEEEMIDALLKLAEELEKLSAGECVESTNIEPDDEEDSIPDVFTLDKTATSLNVAERNNAKGNDVESAIAWSALSFLLGSPAPASVARKCCRKESAKLSGFDIEGTEDEDIPDLSPVGEANDDQVKIDPDQLIYLQAKQDDSFDTYTTASLSSYDTSLSRCMDDIDTGSSGDEEDSIPDVFALDKTTTSLNVAERNNATDKDVESAIAWSALSFLMGSPAPASVTRKSSRKESAKLLGFDNKGTEDEDIPDLSPLAGDSNGDEVEGMTEDSIPDVFALDKTATSLNVAERNNAKGNDVESAIAWSALSFLWGSPAPAFVARKCSRKESAKLLGLNVGTSDEDIPDLLCMG